MYLLLPRVQPDALLRHWRTCEERLRSGLPLPFLPPRKRGRKAVACARCAQLKKKCSGTLPCETCADQGHQCTYARPSSVSSTRPSTARREESLPVVGPPPLPQVTREAAAANAHVDQAMQTLLPDVQLFWSILGDQGAGAPELVWPAATSSSSALVPALPAKDAVVSHAILSEYPTPMSSIPENYSDVQQSSPSRNNSIWDSSHVDPFLLTLTPKPNPPRVKIRFLATFTSSHGMVNSFQCPNTLARKQIFSTLAQPRRALPAASGQTKSPRSMKPALPWGSSQPIQRPGMMSFVDNQNDWRRPALPPSGIIIDDLPTESALSHPHPLTSKAREIIQGVRAAICNKSQFRETSTSWSQSRERSCARFFSPLNLERFVGAFFKLWYPNWPVFHLPTFVATQRSAQLIAGLVLIGACVSPEKSDHDQAMSWMEAVEDWIFSDPDFCEDPIPQTDDEFQLSQVETRLDSLRAAYAILIIMTWEGSEKQMTRGRRTRFSQMVGVARSLFFFATTQGDPYEQSSAGDPFSEWRLFALREECIRTILYVFLIDCAFVMFHNAAPRMVISELRFDLAATEACFQAPDPGTWLKCLTEWPGSRLPGRDMSVSELIEMGMKSELTSDEWKLLEHTSMLNLFGFASSFQNLIFHHHHGPSYREKSIPISQGLKNWLWAWTNRHWATVENEANEPDAYEGGRKIGFYRYVREWWCLAVIMYKQTEYTRSLDVDGEFGLGAARRKQSAGTTFDSSDMGQVHELIVRFQEMDFRDILVE
ncbi:hypothetical protein ACJ41O_003729 [Fusarium nematophilum]